MLKIFNYTSTLDLVIRNFNRNIKGHICSACYHCHLFEKIACNKWFDIKFEYTILYIELPLPI